MFVLPDLVYEYDALEPHIDAQTMKIHHSKHHRGYTDKLNAALEDYPNLQQRDINNLLKNLKDLPTEVQTAVKNNGGGFASHSLFWTSISPDGGGEPEGDLLKKIIDRFKDLKNFKEEFETAALTQFGSGWAWLVVDDDGDLQIHATSNQDSPLSEDEIPLLCLDVWEHAYYLKYQNRRADYVKSFWHIANWKEAARRLLEISQ